MTKLHIKKILIAFRVGMLCFVLICGTTGKLCAQENSLQQPGGTLSLSADADIAQLRIANPPSSVALKANLLYAATLTPNLALEIGLGKKTTLELGGGYNFYDNDKHWKHWLVQPEFRYWFCERFNGSFLGVHALGGEYNFAKLNLPLSVFDDLENYRYEGHFYGGGIVFGYQWILGKRWNIELSLGAGYVRVYYDKYTCPSCGGAVDDGVENYWGPTKASVSFLLFL